MSPAAVETATARLSRLLTLVPWLANRPGIGVEEAAAGLGITPEQLQADLDLIYLCGYGQMPDELIEVDSEGGRIVVRNAETIARPLRLGVDEAITLMVGLRALAEVPGITDTDAVGRALAKLEEATGAAAEAASRVAVDISDAASAVMLARAREAVERHRRVQLRYLVPSRDETTERDVDPMRVVNIDAHWYLEGWCHRAQDTRLFRMDRVEDLTVLDVDGTPPPDATARDLDLGAFQAGPEDPLVTLLLAPGARWVADYYPVESVTERADGGLEVSLRTGDTEWLRRLVLRLGGLGRVVEPAGLADEVAHAAAAALTAYEGID
ncbi:Protein pafC [Nostocoides japonicum T1-X7]|uniref:Protein pafC n=1 Tax=Nostocoides japonicum T1-X7 TaxID=1194083 RepID=A0A077LT55_9MICO|nr:WYL domain-containing protein [Tetrasphaera japonica]CCH76583.1 Protein pafC [Tetrasphaera japonica T1-X7]